MGFWIFMLVMDLLTPVLMTVFGLMFLRGICYRPNACFGYRTNMSLKSSQTWHFAHKYIGKLWLIIGIVLIPLAVIPMLFVVGKNADVVGNLSAALCFIQIICLIVPIFPTEKALKQHFDQDGCPK